MFERECVQLLGTAVQVTKRSLLRPVAAAVAVLQVELQPALPVLHQDRRGCAAGCVCCDAPLWACMQAVQVSLVRSSLAGLQWAGLAQRAFQGKLLPGCMQAAGVLAAGAKSAAAELLQRCSGLDVICRQTSRACLQKPARSLGPSLLCMRHPWPCLRPQRRRSCLLPRHCVTADLIAHQLQPALTAALICWHLRAVHSSVRVGCHGCELALRACHAWQQLSRPVPQLVARTQVAVRNQSLGRCTWAPSSC